MTIGSKLIGTANGPLYYEKSWSGNDDPGSHKTDNEYYMMLRTHRASGSAMECSVWGCQGCTDIATKPHMSDLANSNYALFGEVVAEARFRARSKLALRARAHELDLGNAVGEGRQTMGTVHDALKRITGMARAVKRGDLAGAMRNLGTIPKSTIAKRDKRKLTSRDVSSAHLELTYGIVPLLSDVMEASNAWAAITSKPRKTAIKARGRSVRSGIELSSSPSYYEFKGDFRVGCSLKVVLSEEISSARSLGLLDPVGVAWELLPWSFVADWFIPIGSFLDQLSILPHLNTASVWETLFIEQSGKPGRTFYPYGCSNWSTGVTFSSLDMEEKVIRVQRYPTSLDAGSLLLPKPVPLKDVMSPLRMANAIALAHQQLSGISRPLKKAWRDRRIETE